MHYSDKSSAFLLHKCKICNISYICRVFSHLFIDYIAENRKLSTKLAEYLELMAAKYIYNEEEIVEQLHDPSKCREAFGKVIAHYSEPLYWQIRRMVLNHDDTNDLLQNTFIKAWTNIENFRGDAKLSTWLYKIAINESITFINKEKAKNNVSIDDDDSFLINNLKADEWFDGDELKLQLQKAINQLPEKQRLVFNMRYYDELKYEEISEILGTTVGALKASYHHALKKIEQFFLESD